LSIQVVRLRKFHKKILSNVAVIDSMTRQQQVFQPRNNWIEKSIKSCIEMVETNKTKVCTVQLDTAPYRITFKKKKGYYINFKARTKRKLHKKLQSYLDLEYKKRNGIKMPAFKTETPMYVPKRYMDEYLKICELFCIPKEEIPELRIYPNTVQRGYYGYAKKYDGHPVIRIGLKATQWTRTKKSGLPMGVVVHELLHALGYHHQDDINGYSKYGWHTGNDEFSMLIVKDVYGKKDVVIS